MKTFTIAVALASLGALPAHAQDPEQVDWPVQTFFLEDVAQVQNRGAVQVRSGVRLKDTDTGSRLSVPTDLSVGVLERLQVQAEVPWVRDRAPAGTTSNIPEVELGADWRLVDSGMDGFAASLGLGVEAPTNALARRQAGYRIAPRVRAFQQLGVLGVSGTAEPGVTVIAGENIAPELMVGAGLSLGHGSVVPTVEGLARTGGDESGLQASAGVRVKPWAPLELGVAALGGTQEGEGMFGGAVDLVLQLGE